VRGNLRQLLGATVALAVLTVILEHAGAFSRILESSAGAYATGFNALTGHSGRAVSRVARGR
jgi:hypothetical protein